jgi:hypothetical protein
MEVWRNDLAGYVLETSLCRLFDSRDWCQSSDKSAALLRNTIRSVLTNLLDERNWFNRCSRFEENHYMY